MLLESEGEGSAGRASTDDEDLCRLRERHVEQRRDSGWKGAVPCQRQLYESLEGNASTRPETARELRWERSRHRPSKAASARARFCLLLARRLVRSDCEASRQIRVGGELSSSAAAAITNCTRASRCDRASSQIQFRRHRHPRHSPALACLALALSSSDGHAMSAPTVLCQSSSCPNGHPPSRLECPTCNKFVVPVALLVSPHPRLHQARNQGFLFLRSRMLQSKL